jgi:hypothetical protein
MKDLVRGGQEAKTQIRKQGEKPSPQCSIGLGHVDVYTLIKQYYDNIRAPPLEAFRRTYSGKRFFHEGLTALLS